MGDGQNKTIQIRQEMHVQTMRGSRGGTGGPDPTPPENHKAIELLNNTGPDSLNNQKATKSAYCLLLGHHLYTIYTTCIYLIPSLAHLRNAI